MKRDLTAAQFKYRAEKLGFRSDGFLGYWKLSDGRTSVSVLNAGSRRRDQLRYLIAQDNKNNAREAARMAKEAA